MRYREHADLMVLQLGHWQPNQGPSIQGYMGYLRLYQPQLRLTNLG